MNIHKLNIKPGDAVIVYAHTEQVANSLAYAIKRWLSRHSNLADVSVESSFKYENYRTSAVSTQEQEMPTILVLSTKSIDQVFEDEVLR